MVTVASGDDAGIGADTGADARMSADAYAGAGERSMGVGVSARNWGWRHASRKDFALRHVDFDIRPGERVLLLGASGAGKSTLMAGLAGVLGGDDDGEQEGTLLVGGRDARKVRGVSGLVLQDPDAQTILERVGDDVAFGCENLGVPKDEIWQRARESLDIVGLDYMRFDHSTRKLSGGQRQRLALAGVLAMHPGLLLLDEPTANLDPDGVKEVHDAVKHVVERTGETLIVVEHHIDVWLDTVDRVIVLGKPDGNSLTGGVIADGTPGEVFGTLGDIGHAVAADPSIATEVVRSYLPEAAYVTDSGLTAATEAMADYMIAASEAVTKNEESIIAYTSMGDMIDIDGDGCIDEEIADNHDNDGDGLVDEDMRPNGVMVPETDIIHHKIGQIAKLKPNDEYLELDLDMDGEKGSNAEWVFVYENSNDRDDKNDHRIKAFADLSWNFSSEYSLQDLMNLVRHDTDKNDIKYDLKWRKDNIGGCWINYTEETFLKWFEGRD